MDLYAPWQLDVVRALQGLGPWLASPMKFFTFLGREEFYLAVMPLIFWCFSKPLGIDLSLLLIFSSGSDNFFKGLFRQPRPYWLQSSLMLDTDVSFGIPSGHSMNAVALWGYLVAAWRSPRYQFVRWLLVVVIVLISLSRIYLGVHFTTDVLGGWLLGAILLWLYIRLKPRAVAWLSRLSLAMHTLYAVLVALALVALFSLGAALPTGQPGAYGQLFAVAMDDYRQSAGTAAGMVLGAWIGLALEARYIGFTAGGPVLRRAARYAIGMVVLVGIWFGLKMVFPAGSEVVPIFFRIVRYALMMLWTVAAWPWLWIRLGLGEERETREVGGVGGAPGALAH